jgi:hypothetical protein
MAESPGTRLPYILPPDEPVTETAPRSAFPGVYYTPQDAAAAPFDDEPLPPAQYSPAK